MQRRLQGVSGNEVVVLQKVAARFRRKKDDSSEYHQENAHGKNVMHRVVRMKRNAVEWVAFSIFVRLDFNPIRVVGANFMQRDQMRNNQTQQHQWHSNHVERKETVQGGIAHHEVAADQQCQIRTDEWDGREQVHDHLSAPVTHLTPRQQITHEGFSHQRQENGTAENPNQLTRFAVTAVHQAAEHVQIHHDEERTCAG